MDIDQLSAEEMVKRGNQIQQILVGLTVHQATAVMLLVITKSFQQIPDENHFEHMQLILDGPRVGVEEYSNLQMVSEVGELAAEPKADMN